MSAKLTLDKAGRVVLPKILRDELRLTAGDELKAEVKEGRITLEPVRQRGAMRKEYGIWVFDEGAPSDESIPDVIDREREKRIRELSE